MPDMSSSQINRVQSQINFDIELQCTMVHGRFLLAEMVTAGSNTREVTELCYSCKMNGHVT